MSHTGNVYVEQVIVFFFSFFWYSRLLCVSLEKKRHSAQTRETLIHLSSDKLGRDERGRWVGLTLSRALA